VSLREIRDAGFAEAALPLLLFAFFVGDPLPGAGKVAFLDAFEEAEQVKAGHGGGVVHVFDNRE
jgi:hypothetical protein